MNLSNAITTGRAFGVAFAGVARMWLAEVLKRWHWPLLVGSGAWVVSEDLAITAFVALIGFITLMIMESMFTAIYTVIAVYRVARKQRMSRKGGNDGE